MFSISATLFRGDEKSIPQMTIIFAVHAPLTFLCNMQSLFAMFVTRRCSKSTASISKHDGGLFARKLKFFHLSNVFITVFCSSSGNSHGKKKLLFLSCHRLQNFLPKSFVIFFFLSVSDRSVWRYCFSVIFVSSTKEKEERMPHTKAPFQKYHWSSNRKDNVNAKWNIYVYCWVFRLPTEGLIFARAQFEKLESYCSRVTRWRFHRGIIRSATLWVRDHRTTFPQEKELSLQDPPLHIMERQHTDRIIIGLVWARIQTCQCVHNSFVRREGVYLSIESAGLGPRCEDTNEIWKICYNLDAKFLSFAHLILFSL